MVELVYTQHLKCCAARHVGSIPAPGTYDKNHGVELHDFCHMLGWDGF